MGRHKSPKKLSVSGVCPSESKTENAECWTGTGEVNDKNSNML